MRMIIVSTATDQNTLELQDGREIRPVLTIIITPFVQFFTR